MSANSGGARASWSGKWAFILAAAASAIGLGNLWRFPYLAAKYGGGVFLITYVVLVVTFGFTLMMLEAAVCALTLMALPLLPAAVIGWFHPCPRRSYNKKDKRN